MQTYAAQYMGEVSELLRRLPGVLLLLLKTNDCLRAVDNALVRAGGDDLCSYLGFCSVGHEGGGGRRKCLLY